MTNTTDIKQEPSIKKLMSRMPHEVANSFTEEQLIQLKLALGARQWGKHKVDLRGTFPMPFKRSRVYYVLLVGKNYRELSGNEQAISVFTITVITGLFVFVSILFGLLVLYLIKSALGIDLFSNFSLGIWSWFKEWLG